MALVQDLQAKAMRRKPKNEDHDKEQNGKYTKLNRHLAGFQAGWTLAYDGNQRR